MAKKDLLHYTAHCSTVFFSVKKFKTKNHSSQNILIKANLDISRQFDKNLKIRSFNCFTLWNKCFNCFTLWKKTIVSQCEINECFQKFLSFFSINFCQIHNVHTMKQSFMFNSAHNLQWDPLSLDWNFVFWPPLAQESYNSLRLLLLAALVSAIGFARYKILELVGVKKRNFTLDKMDPTVCCEHC